MIHPARDLLLVEIPKPAAVTEGGIHLPAGARDRLPKGIVRECGKNTLGRTVPYPVGVTVLFSPYAGYDFSEGEGDAKVDYLILHPEDIVATLD